jgi:hypothetical protein
VTRRRIPLSVALVALLVGACGSSTDEDEARAPATTTTTTGAEAAVVSEETVARILVDLDRVQGDVLRRIVETGGVDHDTLAPLEAIFLEPELSAQLETFAGLGDRLGEVRTPPGDNVTTVVRLLSDRADCIYAEVTVDVSATVASPPPPFTSFVALRPLPPGADPADVNPTPYAIAAKHRTAASPCG